MKANVRHQPPMPRPVASLFLAGALGTALCLGGCGGPVGPDDLAVDVEADHHVDSTEAALAERYRVLDLSFESTQLVMNEVTKSEWTRPIRQPDPVVDPDPDPGDAPYDLGEIPAEVDVQWPAAPQINSEVDVYNLDQFVAAASTPGTRILVHGDLGGSVHLYNSDVEIVFDPGITVNGGLHIHHGQRRISVTGGHFSNIDLEIPAQFYPSVVWNPEWMVEDVLIDSVRVDAGDTAFAIRGRRIAVINSHATATRYSVWCGDSGDVPTEDLILAGNIFDSAGPESTVRLVKVVRSVVVDNILSNTAKHNYRIHGESDYNYAARNLLENTGVMLGTMPGDSLGNIWFDDNVMYHSAPDMFNPSRTAIYRLVACDNTVYTDVWGCFDCHINAPNPWYLVNNQRFGYQPPPAR